ncbi:MAG TPA: RibD family protein [Anaerolineales bacterium]|nr:RibD family protein [Anaerolineales bacterium]
MEELFSALQSPPLAKRPWVTLSYAQSLDGCIAPLSRQPLMISGKESLVLTHRLRAAHQAILVGIGTVLSDDPRLTVRLAPGTHPQPVILDSFLRVPLNCKLLTQSRPWLITTEQADIIRREQLRDMGAQVIVANRNGHGQVDLADALQQMARRGVRSVMVEGGSTVLTSFLQSGLIDHLVVTVAPLVLGGLRAVNALSTPLPLQSPHWERFGNDWVFWGRV